MSKTLEQLIYLSGLTHDIGKNTFMFQRKLNVLNNKEPWPKSDPVRHELVSIAFVDQLSSNDKPPLPKYESAWEVPFESLIFKRAPNLLTCLKNIVATHHTLYSHDRDRMYDPITSRCFLFGWKSHLENTTFIQNIPHFFSAAEEQWQQWMPTNYIDKLKQLKTIKTNHVHEAKALILIARWFLIMADHLVSARVLNEHSKVLANTIHDTDKKLGRIGNQSLAYHLNAVGDEALRLYKTCAAQPWKTLSSKSQQNLLNHTTTHPRFLWQKHNCEAIAQELKHKEESPFIPSPVLILNVAGTGAGKTRMNASVLATLRRQSNSNLRITTVLNLRSLTLQTGDAYRDELQLASDELAVVIGDKTTKKLHEQNKQGMRDDIQDDDFAEQTFLSQHTQGFKPPNALCDYFQNKPHATALLCAPCLVATIDYLIAAGEPHKHSNHVDALLRLQHSDLIIDEIDDYSPTSFVAVCRLIEIATMLGRHVVCSSATLPTVMVKQLANAYASGYNMWRSLQHSAQTTHLPQNLIGIVSNYCSATFIKNIQLPKLLTQSGETSSDKVAEVYLQYMRSAEYQVHVQSTNNKATTKSTDTSKTKKVSIASIKQLTHDAVANAIKHSVEQLSNDHSWKHKPTGKTVSLGLIRVGKIKHIPMIVEILSKIPTVFIATYHANDLLIQRHKKEKLLDAVLTRKRSTEVNHPYLNQLLASATTSTVQFIVIASPVEEVGRDHDFDWAIIEPSSVRSIIQTAGRVNRHRLSNVSTANIVLLSHNLNCVTDKANNACERQIHYTRPGFETEENHLPSHDLEDLIPAVQLEDFNAFLRFKTNAFCDMEDRSIAETINAPLDLLTLQKRSKTAWLTRGIYQDYPLRDPSKNQRIFQLTSERSLDEWVLNPKGERVISSFSSITFGNMATRAWLAWSFEELENTCVNTQILPEQGMTVSLTDDNNGLRLHYSPTLGFIRNPNYD